MQLSSATCQTGYFHHILRACVVTCLCLTCRLSVGHHQAYHLSWWAQDRSAGWGKHRLHLERSAGGAGVPPQKRADSSVSSRDASPGCGEKLFSSPYSVWVLLYVPSYTVAPSLSSLHSSVRFERDLTPLIFNTVKMHNWAGLFYTKVRCRKSVNHSSISCLHCCMTHVDCNCFKLAGWYCENELKWFRFYFLCPAALRIYCICRIVREICSFAFIWTVSDFQLL